MRYAHRFAMGSKNKRWVRGTAEIVRVIKAYIANVI